MEYACKVGTGSSYYFEDSESQLREYAWYDRYSEGRAHPVGQKKQNPWGLYDMHGNVWEWCQDTYYDFYTGALTDGSAWEDGSRLFQVLCGGSWDSDARSCRSANRLKHGLDFSDFDKGFRLLREV